VHRVLEKLRLGNALPIVQQRFGLGLGCSRIFLSEKSMGGQMQNVGRMDLKERFFCRLFGGEVGRSPTPGDKLFISSSLSFWVPVKLLKLQSSTSLFSLPRIDFGRINFP
jgi:hypothetical protein